MNPRRAQYDGWVRLAAKLGVPLLDVVNAKRQAERVFARKEAFHRTHRALRPRYE